MEKSWGSCQHHEAGFPGSGGVVGGGVPASRLQKTKNMSGEVVMKEKGASGWTLQLMEFRLKEE